MVKGLHVAQTLVEARDVDYKAIDYVRSFLRDESGRGLLLDRHWTEPSVAAYFFERVSSRCRGEKLRARGGGCGMTADRSLWKRRALLAGGLLATVAWVKGAPYLGSFGKADLEFETLPDLTPFRWLATSGETTSGVAVFAGLEGRKQLTAEQKRLDQSVKSDPCTAFFGALREGPVPVAIFSDFACPNCRIMEARIAELEAHDPSRFRIVRHQLPILGVSSTMASRAVLAAENQGAYREMHDRLIRTPAVTDVSYVTATAASLGLDPDQFATDLNSVDVEQTLQLTEAIARVFGFYGTPAFAVGRTVFLGAIPTSTLQALIAIEVENPCQTG